MASEGGAGESRERDSSAAGDERGTGLRVDRSWDAKCGRCTMGRLLADSSVSDRRRAWTWLQGSQRSRLEAWAHERRDNIPGGGKGRESTSKSQAQHRLNTSPCTETRGYRELRYRLQQWVEVAWTLHSRRHDVRCWCCGDMDSAVHKRGADRGGAAASAWPCQRMQ